LFTEAQQYYLSASTNGFSSNDVVYLKRYEGREEITIDSIVGNHKKKLVIHTESSAVGLYFITYLKSGFAEFIFNPTEKIKIEIHKESLLKGKLNISPSLENYAYTNFVQTYLPYEESFYKVSNQKLSEFDPALVANTIKKTKELQTIQQNFNRKIDSLQLHYPSTYTTALCHLVTLPAPNSNDATFDYYPAYLFRHFWDSISLSNQSILHHFLLNEQLKNYFRHFVPKHQDSIKVAIDILLHKTPINTAVVQHIKSFLLRNFLNSNAEDLVMYIHNKTTDNTCSLGLTSADSNKFEILKKTSIGATAPDLALPDIKQKPISLRSVTAKNKLTIVLFWAAHCGMCRAELPVLKKMYQHYKTDSIEVYAINLDENKLDWHNALQEFELGWINVSDTEPLKQSKTVKNFNIQHTPSLFLLNTNNEILDKGITTLTLEKHITQLLKK